MKDMYAKRKLVYTAPSIKVLHIQLEQGICTGSSPGNNSGNNDVEYQWDSVVEEDRELAW